MASTLVLQHAQRCASLPSCPQCRRDLLTSCLHESYLLFCRCGRRIRVEDLAADVAPPGEEALVSLLRQCEEQLGAVNGRAGDVERSEGLLLLLRHLEAQILLLRALTRD